MVKTKFAFPKIACLSIISACCLFLLAACSNNSRTPQLQANTPAAMETEPSITQPAEVVSTIPPTPEAIKTHTAASPPDAITTPMVEAVLLDACTLLDKVEVEAAVGNTVGDPKSEELANLACCSYGNPVSPIISIVTVCVFTGNETEYYAGAVAQAQEVFAMAKNNVSSAQPVSGLGDDAFWDDTFNSLNVLQGIYALSVEISLDSQDKDASIDISKELAQKIIQRLP